MQRAADVAEHRERGPASDSSGLTLQSLLPCVFCEGRTRSRLKALIGVSLVGAG